MTYQSKSHQLVAQGREIGCVSLRKLVFQVACDASISLMGEERQEGGDVVGWHSVGMAWNKLNETERRAWMGEGRTGCERKRVRRRCWRWRGKVSRFFPYQPLRKTTYGVLIVSWALATAARREIREATATFIVGSGRRQTTARRNDDEGRRKRLGHG